MIKVNNKFVARDTFAKYLRIHDWFVLFAHSNSQQCGFPNIWATHKLYGARWIHCVLDTSAIHFTTAQSECFPKMCAFGSGVWILSNRNIEIEYKKLWQPCNWQAFSAKARVVGYKRDPIPEFCGPERLIQNDLIQLLKSEGWFVMETHGNMYQRGFPDLWATHYLYGSRWIEVKNPRGYGFTPAQLATFPRMCENGSGVWILGAATKDELMKLQQPFNWWQYLVNLNQRTANV